MHSKRRRPSTHNLPGLLALALAGGLAAQTAISLPAWLSSYPGAIVRNQSTPGLLESTYETSAKPEAVIAHYRELFQTAGLLFQPSFDGIGTAVRGSAPEGDLLILIRQQGAGTFVCVDVTPRSPAFAAAGSPAAVPSAGSTRPTFEDRVAEGREHTRKVLEKAETDSRKRVEAMEKYDQPMRPARRPPPPALAWPSWLVHIDGAPLQIEKASDQVGLKILKCSYATYQERNAIQSFYAGLLNSHGFPVNMQSGPTWPLNRNAWVVASDHAMDEGPRIEIRIEIGAVGEALQVDLRMTARP